MELIECNRMSKREMTMKEEKKLQTSSKENAEHAKREELWELRCNKK